MNVVCSHVEPFLLDVNFLSTSTVIKILLTWPAQKANVQLACFEVSYSKSQHGVQELQEQELDL